MNDAEIKKLIRTLKNYYVSRSDCQDAAKLIEASYVGDRFRHEKRGTYYTVVGQARIQFTDVAVRVREWLDEQLKLAEHSEEAKIVMEVICDNIDGMMQEAGYVKDGDMMVLYRGDDGVMSVRHPLEFHDGRFKKEE